MKIFGLSSQANTPTAHSDESKPNKCPPESEENIQIKIELEKLRQTRWSFNISIGIKVVVTFIQLAGVILLLQGEIPEGAITTAGGMAAVMGERAFQLSKEETNNLD